MATAAAPTPTPTFCQREAGKTLPDSVLERIIRLKLGRIAERVRAHHHARFDYDDKLVEAVLARCTEVDSGARNVDHILSGTLLHQVAQPGHQAGVQLDPCLGLTEADGKGEVVALALLLEEFKLEGNALQSWL